MWGNGKEHNSRDNTLPTWCVSPARQQAISPQHSPRQGPTLETPIPGLCRGTCLRNSSYLHVLLPRDPVPSGRPGPQSESQPGPVYKKEKECLLPSGPSSQDNPTAMKSESPQASLAAFLCRAHTQKARAQCCVCLPMWVSHPQEEIPEELGTEEPPFTHHPPLQCEHMCSLTPFPAEVHRGKGSFSLKGKKEGPCSHPYLTEPRAEGKCLQSSSWVRGRHGTPVPRCPGSGQHKRRLCSAACLLCSRRSCRQRGATQGDKGPQHRSPAVFPEHQQAVLTA